MLLQTEALNRLTELDALFEYQTPAPAGEPWFSTQQGSVPVLVSAPHACSHARDGEFKAQEEFTGALALYLAETCHCHAIVTRHQTDEDPNWQEQGEYKDAIKHMVDKSDIRFVIDLHGMRVKHNMGVALGTINGKSCSAREVTPHFTEAGFIAFDGDQLNPSDDAWRRIVVDHRKFTGGVVSKTVTRFVSEQLGLQSVQIELSSEVRVVDSPANNDWPQYSGEPNAIMATLNALQSLVKSFS